MRTDESVARIAKSTSLLILLLRAKITTDLAHLMTAADWKQAAQAAKVNPPSRETRVAVLAMLHQVETPLTGETR